MIYDAIILTEAVDPAVIRSLIWTLGGVQAGFQESGYLTQPT